MLVWCQLCVFFVFWIWLIKCFLDLEPVAWFPLVLPFVAIFLNKLSGLVVIWPLFYTPSLFTLPPPLAYFLCRPSCFAGYKQSLPGNNLSETYINNSLYEKENMLRYICRHKQFFRAKCEENWLSSWPDYAQGQIFKCIFNVKWGLLCKLSFKYFLQIAKWGMSLEYSPGLARTCAIMWHDLTNHEWAKIFDGKLTKQTDQQLFTQSIFS